MPNILEKFNFNLSNDEKDRLSESLAIEDNIYTKEEIREVLDKAQLLQMVSEMFYQDSEKSKPDEHTELFNNYKVDIVKLFQQSDKIDNLISSEKNMNKSALSKANTMLDDIENELYKYETLSRKNDGFIHGFREDFNDTSGFTNSLDKNLFVDTKIGLTYNENLIMQLDQTRNGIVLNSVNNNRPFISHIKKINQIGSGLIEDANKTNSIQDVFKGEVWSEVILSDQPFEVQVKEPAYYGKSKGALCKLQIVFDNVQPVNNININPFLKFPFEIVSVLAYKNIETLLLLNSNDKNINPEILDDVVEIVAPNEKATYKSFLIDKPVGLNFETIDRVKAIEIAIRQPHYKLDTYSISRKEVDNINIMERLFKKVKFLKTINKDKGVDSIAELDNYNKHLLWEPYDSIFERFTKLLTEFNDNYIVDKTLGIFDKLIPGFNKDNFTKVSKNKMFKAKTYTNNVKKYQYQYGFKNIDIMHSQYSSMGIFVSKPYKANSSVKEIAIEVDEHIPVVGGEECGSIEYYISSSGDPGENEWHRVIPDNKSKEIKNEFMYSRNSGIEEGNKTELIFDFPADKNSITIYDKDGNEVEIIVYFDENNKPADTDRTPVKKVRLNTTYNTSVLYFADYKIHDDINPFIVDLEKVAEPKVKVEEFDGTDSSNMIKLESYPFINYELINDTTVDPDVIADEITNPSNEFKKLIYDNPNTFEYNPNYKIGDEGYRPIKVSLEDPEYFIFDKEVGDIIQYNEKILNDNLGLTYSHTYYDDNENTLVTRFQDNLKYEPYFFNRTDYKSRTSNYLNKFDYVKHPVLEYTQEGNTLVFNSPIGENNDFNGKIKVKYQYLTDEIRVKIIVRKKSSDESGTTPILNSYMIKTRDFQY